jgi:DNA-binding MarR family transcriptional regulator
VCRRGTAKPRTTRRARTLNAYQLAWERRRGRGVPLGAGDFIVLEVITEDRCTLSAIAAEAKVELSAARDALKRLRQQGKVRKYGGRRNARYVRVKSRAKRRAA